MLLIFAVDGELSKIIGTLMVAALILRLYAFLFSVFAGDIDDLIQRRARDEALIRSTPWLSKMGFPLPWYIGRIFQLFVIYFLVCALFTLEYSGLSGLHDSLYCVTCDPNMQHLSIWDEVYYSFITPLTVGTEFVPRGLFTRLLTVIQVAFGPIFIVMLLLQVRSAATAATTAAVDLQNLMSRAGSE